MKDLRQFLKGMELEADQIDTIMLYTDSTHEFLSHKTNVVGQIRLGENL